MYCIVSVGSGSGGGVVTGRLTEDGKHSVLLLEAGLDDLSPLGHQAHVPANYLYNFKTDLDWEYYTEPQNKSCMAMKDKVCQIKTVTHLANHVNSAICMGLFYSIFL